MAPTNPKDASANVGAEGGVARPPALCLLRRARGDNTYTTWDIIPVNQPANAS